MLSNPKLFPTIMIILGVLSALSYAIKDMSDWRHIGYWLAASFLTYCVTY